MKFLVISREDMVQAVYGDLEKPTIYLDDKKVVHSNGEFEIPDLPFVLVEDEVQISPGTIINEDFYKDHDKSLKHLVFLTF